MGKFTINGDIYMVSSPEAEDDGSSSPTRTYGSVVRIIFFFGAPRVGPTVARSKGQKRFHPEKHCDLSDQHGDFTCDVHGAKFFFGQSC